MVNFLTEFTLGILEGTHVFPDVLTQFMACWSQVDMINIFLGMDNVDLLVGNGMLSEGQDKIAGWPTWRSFLGLGTN